MQKAKVIGIGGGPKAELYAKRISIVMLALYLILSLAYQFVARVPEVRADAAVYDNLAMDLLHGQGFNSTYRTPLYPAFLAAVYLIFGHNYQVVYAIQALASVLTLGLMMLISRRIFGSLWIGVIASFLYVLYRPFLDSTVVVLTESVTGLLVALMVYSLICAFDRRSVWSFLLTGVLAGLLTLCKAVALLYPFLMLPFIFAIQREKKARLSLVTALLAGFMLVVAPWTVRNYRVTGHIVPVATGGGFNFWLGNWDGYYQEKPWPWRQYPPELAKKLAGKPEVEQDSVFMHEALQNLRNDPIGGIRILGKKFTHLWFAVGHRYVYTLEGEKIPKTVRKTTLVEAFIMLTALVSILLRIWRSYPKAIPATVLLAYWTAAYVAATAENRYSHPVMPLLMMLSAYTIYWALSPDARRKRLSEVKNRA